MDDPTKGDEGEYLAVQAKLDAALAARSTSEDTPRAEASHPSTQRLIEAAEKLRAGMKGHYVHAEDLYCFDEALSQYRSGK